jgi:hypothetical protein
LEKSVPLPAIGPALWAMFRELNSRNFAPVHETLRPFAKLVAPTEDTHFSGAINAMRGK